MSNKTYQIAFALGAKLLSNFNSTFNAASKQITGLENKSAKANKGFLGLGSGIKKSCWRCHWNGCCCWCRAWT